MSKLDELLNFQNGISNLQYTLNILMWELQITAPNQSKDDIINLITHYENKLFEMQTSEQYGSLLENLIDSDEFSKLEDDEQRYINNLLRHYKDDIKIPQDFYIRYSKLKNQSNLVWMKAKENNDYELFKPYLKSIIEMTKTYCRYIDNTTTNLYDILLNKFETGITSEIIDKLFEDLKIALIPLIMNINSGNIAITKDYTDSELMDCATFLLEYIGFDMNRGALGIYPHGFTATVGQNDIRIAFKHTNNPLDFVSTIIHEGGHGIFEQNVSEKLSKYENVGVDNLYALHESQSRFYENILGRNINFWIPIYNKVKEKLKLDMNLEEFVDKLNQPQLGLIRTEADELTYCLHIILRYEIERDLFNDKIDLNDLPKIWNMKMKEYLGVEVENDADGLMQDVHWSEGEFGYFPSYLLGTIYDGMFLEAIEKDLGDIDELLKNGKIRKITNYLIDKIYKYGGAYNSLEVMNNIGQKELSVKPIVSYFEKKYGVKSLLKK